MTVASERRAVLETASRKLFDQVAETITQLKKFESPQLRDDYDKIHMQLLFLTESELELSHFYRISLEIKDQVEVSLARAKDVLADAQMEAVNKPTFKPLGGYSSRVETEGRLRALTFEETYEVSHWEELYRDVKRLTEVIKSYQQDFSKRRRDVDTRLKILSFRL